MTKSQHELNKVLHLIDLTLCPVCGGQDIKDTSEINILEDRETIVLDRECSCGATWADIYTNEAVVSVIPQGQEYDPLEGASTLGIDRDKCLQSAMAFIGMFYEEALPTMLGVHPKLDKLIQHEMSK